MCGGLESWERFSGDVGKSVVMLSTECLFMGSDRDGDLQGEGDGDLQTGLRRYLLSSVACWLLSGGTGVDRDGVGSLVTDGEV